jgi:hypothetical protein
MNFTLEERLNQILPRITSRDFLDSKGLGNEIGFWIFDYPPEREMDVRGFLNGTVLPALGKQAEPRIRCHGGLAETRHRIAGRAQSAGQSHGDAEKQG